MQISEGARLLMLKNPWGNYEWAGKWSDHDRAWTPALREEVDKLTKSDLASDVQNDGWFWIEWKDFCEYFGEIAVGDVKHRAGPALGVVEFELVSSPQVRLGRQTVLQYLRHISNASPQIFCIF